MTNALNWLNDLMVWLGRWVPRILLVRATHSGVRFGLKGSVKLLTPGVHFYWPIVQEVELISTRRRTISTSNQLHNMEVIGVIVTYRVSDPIKLLMTFNDLVPNLDQRTQANLSQCYDKTASNADLNQRIFERLFNEFAETGVEIFEVAIAERSECLPIKQVGEWGYHEARDLK